MNGCLNWPVRLYCIPTQYCIPTHWYVLHTNTLVCNTNASAFVLHTNTALTRQPIDMTRADHLQEILTNRLYKHVHTRVLDPSKRSHWCLQWFQDNLPRLCAMAVMSGQIKQNIQTAKSDACLMTPNNLKYQEVEYVVGPDGGAAFSAPIASASLEGCYLYREEGEDENRWIHSGKSCGVKCNFGDRHKQHQKGSLLQEEKPSKSICRIHARARTMWAAYGEGGFKMCISMLAWDSTGRISKP